MFFIYNNEKIEVYNKELLRLLFFRIENRVSWEYWLVWGENRKY